MVIDIFRHVLRFFVLVLVQGLILKNIEPGFYITPFLYVLFLIQLPFELPSWLILLISFVTGYCVDLFYDTMGMHMIACTLLGFARPSLLKLMAPRDGYEFGQQPTMQDMGTSWFLTYAVILVIVHHLTLFYVEMFSFREFFFTLFRALISMVATMLLIVVTQFLLYRKRTTPS
jgi:rod shape-determining protein MreD